jgi:hypothetical protein
MSGRAKSPSGRAKSPTMTAAQALSYAKAVSKSDNPKPLAARVMTLDKPVYAINFTTGIITHVSEQGVRQDKALDEDSRATLERLCTSDPKITKFSEGTYLVSSHFEPMKQIHDIFKKLKAPSKSGPAGTSKGGSRRRRHVRKYKKSKRVLRRKSRSTRRR